MGLAVCRLGDNPRSVAEKVLERRRNSDPRFDVDLYVTAHDTAGDIAAFLGTLSSMGVTNRVRVVVSSTNGPVTFENFNVNPAGAFKDYDELTGILKGTKDNSVQAAPQ